MHTVTLTEAVARMQAATRFFLTFDKRQLPAFGDTIPDVWKSFWAFAIVAPLQFYMAAMLYQGTPMEQAPWMTRLVGELAGYAIQAVYWPLAMVMIADMLQMPERYARYVSAYNWCVVPATIAGALIILVFGAEQGMGGVPGLILTVWIFVLRVKLARRVFDEIPIPIAIALAAGDFMLGALVIWMQAGAMAPG